MKNIWILPFVGLQFFVFGVPSIKAGEDGIVEKLGRSRKTAMANRSKDLENLKTTGMNALSNLGAFVTHSWKRYKGEVTLGSACDSIGTTGFQKKHFLEKHGVSSALANCDSNQFNLQKKQILEKSLGLSQREFGQLQRDAALLVLAQDYARRVDENRVLAKKISSEFKAFVRAGFSAEASPLSEDSVQVALDAQAVLSELSDIVKKAKVKDGECCEELSKNEDIRRIASVSPVVAVRIKEALDLISRSPDGVAANDIAILCQQAGEEMDRHVTREQVEVGSLVANLKKNPSQLPFSEQQSIEEMRRKFVKKLVHGNPITAAAVIEGIQPNGTYVPTEFEILSKSLCELDSIEYEITSHEVQDDFFVNAGIGLIPFTRIGPLALAAHALLEAKDSNKLMDQCLELKKEFDGDLAVEAGLALRAPGKESLSSLATAQVLAINSCVTSARIGRAMSFANAGLALLGAGGAVRGIASPVKMGIVSTILKWSGRALSSASAAQAGYEVYEACSGERTDENSRERCSLAKKNLSLAAVFVVGNEALHIQNSQKPSLVKKEEKLPLKKVDVVVFKKPAKVTQSVSPEIFRANHGSENVRPMAQNSEVDLPRGIAVFLVPQKNGGFREIVGKASASLMHSDKVIIRGTHGGIAEVDPHAVLVAPFYSSKKIITWANPEKASGVAIVRTRGSRDAVVSTTSSQEKTTIIDAPKGRSMGELQSKFGASRIEPMVMGTKGKNNAAIFVSPPEGEATFLVKNPDGTFEEVVGVGTSATAFGDVTITTINKADGLRRVLTIKRESLWLVRNKR